MLESKDFTLFENQIKFDLKGFIIKTAGYWKWFLVSWIVAFVIAYNVNIRKEKIYELQTTIAVKEERNPFFTTNTSLVFNWGGSSDQVQSLSSTLKSRSHNELVVSKLDFFIDYLKEDKYYLKDMYGLVPFKVVLDKSKPQLLKSLISIKFVSENEYDLSVNFEEDYSETFIYDTNSLSKKGVNTGVFTKRFKIDQATNLPFLNFQLEKVEYFGNYIGQEFFIKFNTFDATVSKYRNIKTGIDKDASSLINLSLQGTNKNRLVTYLNETVKTIIKVQLEKKNQFATNTIAFIDSTLMAMESKLKENESELKTFSKNKNYYQINTGGSQISNKILNFEVEKDGIVRKIAYYNSLKNYLVSSVDFSKLPAPSVAGIDDPNIAQNVSKIITLSTERAQKPYLVKNPKLFKDFDVQIDALKSVLLENISTAKTSAEYDLSVINSKLNQAESEISKLPEDEQEILKITRKYDLNNAIFTNFLSKRNEANIVKAANLADVHFIDPAKDIGDGQIGPNTKVNYVLAFFLGLFIPLLAVFIIFFLENTILNAEDISKLTTIPIIGIIGIKHTKSNLAVFEKQKSSLSESFRAIRSSLQFMYKKNKIEGAKTLMLTSSISGEGKTFCSINIATVFALSEKKTIIVGLDLRKPKIFDDFKIKNDIGVVNHLIGQKSLDEVIQNTHIPFLDVITSGPIPPNPSELLIGETMDKFISDLKERYDYIILDTPPVGLVADAIELAVYADLTLYIVRQNYTKKEMINLLNNRIQREELKNVSIVFNGFENRAKYGTGYGQGYGYGYGYGYVYGNYSNGYGEEEKPTSLKEKIQKKFKR
ncbi:polysaccharide biosynthesis tyrosine autokinase [Flavobacterium azooxidireducens]|uniref:non-specific protein-tyrosine kinase n=1 Tax=Flavobacterium azooxidireducens TaxID=1871076 RepID=A0ABY4KIT5_9FLAO|nr:tyrosine-protein kinase family protein [Flavobacterium azooxidireducens]UPQ79300.1 polysaccharide biosynthesis tyrosine autokinase [Flavobacterium azooxidireducens]